jgi:hypothetical protein
MTKNKALLMIGKKCTEFKNQNRIGTIENIAFNSKDFKIVWFRFKWKFGQYLISADEIILIENNQLTLF